MDITMKNNLSEKQQKAVTNILEDLDGFFGKEVEQIINEIILVKNIYKEEDNNTMKVLHIKNLCNQILGKN